MTTVPYDRRNAPKLPLGHGTNVDKPHSYIMEVGPQTGPVTNSTTAKPGAPQPKGKQEFPPNNLYYGMLDRQKTLETFDIMPVAIGGPSTEVKRYVQEFNWQLPSPRWTARKAPPVFRYIREYGQRYSFYMNGSHFSMASYYPLQHVVSRTMNRNRIVPRNVPAPLDDQMTDTSIKSDLGTVFSRTYSWK